MNISVGEVWFADFPYEDDPSQISSRPVIVLDVDTLEVLSVKVTKSAPRPEDKYDTPIVFWQNANLRFQSTARVSKTIILDKSAFKHKIGDLHPDDLSQIQNQFMTYISDQSE